MVEIGHGAGFAAETFLGSRIVSQITAKELDSDKPVEPRVSCFIHFAHAAIADTGENFIRSKLGSIGQRFSFDSRRLEKAVRVFVGRKQGLHFCSDRFLDADLIEIAIAFARSFFQCDGEDGLDLSPLFGIHALSPLLLISRCSQARAVAHSRFTVAGEIPSTSAVSSMERPPKNRSSTTRLCCESSAASWLRASSSATTSISRSRGSAMSGVSSRRGAPAPRLAALRFRA